MSTQPELPPLSKFDFMARKKILEHKLEPLRQEAVIHGLENNHEVTTAWGAGVTGETTAITVVKFRVLFGSKGYADFMVSDEYVVAEDSRQPNPVIGAWEGGGLITLVKSVVEKRQELFAA